MSGGCGKDPGKSLSCGPDQCLLEKKILTAVRSASQYLHSIRPGEFFLPQSGHILYLVNSFVIQSSSLSS